MNYKECKILDKINVIKRKLTETDYMAIKHAEGALSFDEYAETMQKRREWRTEINALETELKMLKG